MGRMIEVDITSAGKHYLMSQLTLGGSVTRPSNVPPPLIKGRVSGQQYTTTEHHQVSAPDDYPAHPLWVQLTVVAVITALLIKIIISVFMPA